MFSQLALTSLLCALALSSGKPLEDARTLVRDIETLETRDSIVTADQEVRRSRRSLTALLAAEVIFLERILALQHAKTAESSGRGRKPRKIASPRPGPSHAHSNTIDTRTKSKPQHKPAQVTAAPVQVFRFGPPGPAPPARAPASVPSVSSLDPFVMLQAPDLSQNSYGEYEIYQTRKSPAPLASVTSSRGRHVSHLVAEPEIEIVTAPSVLVSDTFSVGVPETRQKRKLHYGAFELYQL